MTTRKKKTAPIKTPEAIAEGVAERKAIPVTELTDEQVELISKAESGEIVEDKGPNFDLVQQVLAHSGLKYGETADDKISIIALKFYQRINKLPITGKLDEATLKDMGLN